MEYLIEGLKKEELNFIRGGQECSGGCIGGFTCDQFKCTKVTCNTVTS